MFCKWANVGFLCCIPTLVEFNDVAVPYFAFVPPLGHRVNIVAVPVFQTCRFGCCGPWTVARAIGCGMLCGREGGNHPPLAHCFLNMNDGRSRFEP